MNQQEAVAYLRMRGFFKRVGDFFFGTDEEIAAQEETMHQRHPGVPLDALGHMAAEEDDMGEN